MIIDKQINYDQTMMNQNRGLSESIQYAARQSVILESQTISLKICSKIKKKYSGTPLKQATGKKTPVQTTYSGLTKY